MIKPIGSNKSISRTVQRTGTYDGEMRTMNDIYYLTQFVADEITDIAAMNAAGSEYLNYPAGSAAICMEDGNVYVMNAAETEYAVPGGDGT